MLSGCGAESPPSRFAVAVAEARAAKVELIAFRHDLHRHPELAGEEVRTSQRVAAALSAHGLTVRTDVGGHGVVAVLRGAKPGPLIAYRADMDAVPGDALDPVPYASEVEGVHHICGHDLHTAIGVGVATSLAAVRDRLAGEVMFLFQPAEEAGIGAEAMLADGVFDDRLPEAIFALHAAPLEKGTLGAMPNALMAGRARLSVEVSGPGDLAPVVERLRAAILAVNDVAPDAITVARSDPFVAIDLFAQATTVDQRATINALVTAPGLEWRQAVEDRLRREIAAVDSAGAEVRVSYRQALEGVNNDPALLDRANRAIAARAPDLEVVSLAGVIPAFSEDFGSFQQRVPGVLYFLGVNNSAVGTTGFPHRPDFVADDAAILVGVEAMLAAILALSDGGRTAE